MGRVSGWEGSVVQDVGVGGVAVDSFANHPVGDVGEVLGEGVGQFLKLGPEGVVDERLGNPSHDGGRALPLVAEGADAVAAQQGDEEFPRPRVGEGEAVLPGRVGVFGGGQPLLDPLASLGSRVSLTQRHGAREEGLDAAQFLDQGLFVNGGHGRSRRTMVADIRTDGLVNLRRGGRGCPSQGSNGAVTGDGHGLEGGSRTFGCSIQRSCLRSLTSDEGESMADQGSILQKLGGVRRVAIMAALFAAGAGFYHWQNSGAGDALREVGEEFGLEVQENGQRRLLRGSVDDMGIEVRTTIDNVGGESRWFTDYAVTAPGQPSGRIVGASLRQKAIGAMQDSEWLDTGDAAFDDAVLVAGDPTEIAAHLDDEARVAILAAADAGWTLEDGTWRARKSGRMVRATKIRSILDLGMAAARATQRNDDPAASGVVAFNSQEPLTPENAPEVLAELNTPRSLDAALLLASDDRHRQEVRNRLLSAVFAEDRLDEVIPVLGEIGGPVEIAVLSSVQGEHEAAAQAAVAAIEARQ
jgi:hypothetical protein